MTLGDYRLTISVEQITVPKTREQELRDRINAARPTSPPPSPTPPVALLLTEDGLAAEKQALPVVVKLPKDRVLKEHGTAFYLLGLSAANPTPENLAAALLKNLLPQEINTELVKLVFADVSELSPVKTKQRLLGIASAINTAFKAQYGQGIF